MLLDGDNLICNTDRPNSGALIPGAVNTFPEPPASSAAKRQILWDNVVQLYGERVVA